MMSYGPHPPGSNKFVVPEKKGAYCPSHFVFVLFGDSCPECGKKIENPNEAINHPSHYGGKDNPLEHIKVVEAMGWDYWIGNCTKYLWRVGKKDPAKELEDYKKAKFYLDAKIEMMERKSGGR